MFSPTSNGRGKKRLNFELNLVPFIDILSTCICFLLVTTVFMSLGSFHVSQAIGDKQTQDSQAKQGSVSVSMGSEGSVRFSVENVPSFQKNKVFTVKGERGQVDFSTTEKWIEYFSRSAKDIKTVMIMPNPTSRYNDIIQLMSQFRKNSIDQIGIAPL